MCLHGSPTGDRRPPNRNKLHSAACAGTGYGSVAYSSRRLIAGLNGVCICNECIDEAVMRTHERAGHPTDEVYEITATA